ncbi:MAG: histidine phosphatase family protein [Rhodospirillaceae bacterium]|nr:histidine phosphatase family protein [Rhodospirillaceae bacterium]
MTKTLYLLRHAKSDQSAADTVKDHLRPLAPRGIKAAQAMEAYLAAHRIAVDRVYCSTATRTRETLDLVRDGLNSPSVSFRDKLYLAAADDLLAFVQSIPDAIKAAMIIGHNPGFHDLALTLTSRAGAGQAKALDKMRTKYPTGALCVLTFNVNSWKKVDTGLGTLTAFVRPKDLKNG